MSLESVIAHVAAKIAMRISRKAFGFVTDYFRKSVRISKYTAMIACECLSMVYPDYGNEYKLNEMINGLSSLDKSEISFEALMLIKKGVGITTISDDVFWEMIKMVENGDDDLTKLSNKIQHKEQYSFDPININPDRLFNTNDLFNDKFPDAF